MKGTTDKDGTLLEDVSTNPSTAVRRGIREEASLQQAEAASEANISAWDEPQRRAPPISAQSLEELEAES